MRVVFPKRKQKRFIEYAKLRSGKSRREFRKSLDIRNHVHYRYEKCSLPLRVFQRALKISNISPARAKTFHYRYVESGHKIALRLNPNTDLAELIGICLGDGHLRQYTLQVFGDKSKDTIQLLEHVLPLMRKVLRVTPKLRTKRPDENFLVLNSAVVARSLHRVGLRYGDKTENGARIPKWIFNRKSLVQGCV